MSDPLYARRDVVALGPLYVAHVSAMTTEGLDAKSAIAAELAHRDAHIAALEAEVARLRGALVDAGVPREMVDLLTKGATPPRPEPTKWDGRSWPTVRPRGEWRYHINGRAPFDGFFGEKERARKPDGIYFNTGCDIVFWDVEFEPGERFTPLDDDGPRRLPGGVR